MFRRYGLCYYLSPATPGRNYKRSKGRVLYESGKKPRPYPKGWRGQVVKYNFDDEDGGEVDSYKDKDLGVPEC